MAVASLVGVAMSLHKEGIANVVTRLYCCAI